MGEKDKITHGNREVSDKLNLIRSDIVIISTPIMGSQGSVFRQFVIEPSEPTDVSNVSTQTTYAIDKETGNAIRIKYRYIKYSDGIPVISKMTQDTLGSKAVFNTTTEVEGDKRKVVHHFSYTPF